MTDDGNLSVPPSLARLFLRGRRRLRRVWLAAISSDLAPWVALTGLIIVFIGWIRPWGWPEPVAVALILLAALTGLVGAVVKPLRPRQVARALDRGLVTDDALVSALQFAPDDVFGQRIHDRAQRYVDADVAAALPAPWRPRRLLVAAGLLGLVAIGIAARNPQDDTREQRAADREAIEDVAEQFDDEAARLEADPESEDGAELADRLRRLAQDLRAADDIDAAIYELEATQDELLASIDAGDLAQRAAAQGLQRTLETNPVAEGSSAAEQLDALAESLASLSPAERAEVAERLEQLAETQSVGDPATAEALADAAEQLAAGNLAGAAAALETAAASAETAAGQAAAGARVSQAAAAAGQAADGLRQQASGSGEGQGEGEGQGQGQGQGEGQGQGQGQGEGQGQGTGGASGSGTSATGQPQGGTAGSAPDPSGTGAQGDGPSTPPPDTPVLIPRGGASDPSRADVPVTGDGSGDSEQLVAGATGSGTVAVPLRSIAGEYAARATEALAGTNIAPSEADTVARYFESISGRG